ncbi:hypothetical protein [Pseudomonas typographi]|uniref:SPOR domain-containing protein n=1 Tax=Pseudomonas typographi TaxID=2715964 RepID=A0ABR7Z7H5_9PSED|nr:hypothetical protein [Pseudomonas typographi]MBD1553990.1 hypothetical protein [Pseudomonas typographi]MBD1589265.1 hypothetical protein [Pseudomonas typographi]MBD1601293.1 hypothetical protein [Pseudomonas typographi]
MDDIFLLVEHSRDMSEVQVLGWFATERQARETADALEWRARCNAPKAGEAGPGGAAAYRRYSVKGISRFHPAALSSSTTVH